MPHGVDAAFDVMTPASFNDSHDLPQSTTGSSSSALVWGGLIDAKMDFQNMPKFIWDVARLHVRNVF